MAPERFQFRLDRRSRPLLRVFGVRGVENAFVELDDVSLAATFGWAHVRVPLSNITGWRIEGPWKWITAIGIRRSVRHADLSFAGSARGGVRLDFKEPMKLGPVGMPALYVGVEDLEGLAAVLVAHGIPGVDARIDKSPVPPV